MKKFLIGFLIAINVLEFGCTKTITQDQNVEIQQQKEDEKREEFLNNAESYVKNKIDEMNKKEIEDKITLVREDNVITYILPTSDDMTMTELINSYPTGDESMKKYAKNIRQITLNAVSDYYDKIVEEYGNEYEFYIRSSKSYGGETFLIMKYGKDGYEIELDLFEEYGY